LKIVNARLKKLVPMLMAMMMGAKALSVVAEEVIEEVVVVGKSIKASTQSSIDAKWMADNVALV
jgi:hypothetical protein